MIMNERAFALGLAFRQGLLSVCKKLAQDEKRWITIHPNGKFDMNGDPIKGQPILIDDDTGVVIGGAGGALNGKKLTKLKKKPTKKTIQGKTITQKPPKQKQQTPKQKQKTAKQPTDFEKSMGADYVAYRNIIRNGDKTALSVFNKAEKYIKFGDTNSKEDYYGKNSKRIFIGLKKDMTPTSTNVQGSATTHESGHAIDCFVHREGWSARGYNFASIIKNDVQNYVKAKLTEMKNDFSSLTTEQFKAKYKGFNVQNFIDLSPRFRWKPNKGSAYEEVALEFKLKENDDGHNVRIKAISDIFSGATLNKTRGSWIHETSYWKDRGDDGLCREAFADLFTVSLHAPNEMKEIEKVLPNTVKCYKQILKDLETNYDAIRKNQPL